MIPNWKLERIASEIKEMLELASEFDCEFGYVLNEETRELSVIEYTEAENNSVRPDEIARFKLVKMTD